MKRGQIWWAELPEPNASEPGYRRPVIIVQADAFNASRINTVIVAALTTNMRLAAAPGNVRLSKGKTGLSKDSVVNVSQIMTLDKSFLAGQVGRLDSQTMLRIDEGLQLVLGLQFPI